MRALILKSIFYAGLIILGLGLFQTQVIQGGSFRRLSEQNRVRLIPVEAPRGRVFDAKGKLLATNRPSYDVVATPEDVEPEVFPRLAKLLNLPEKEIRHRMSSPREYPFAPAVIQNDVPRELAFMIEERNPELPGVYVQVSFRRFYPYEQTASHIIGFIGKIGEQEYKTADRERYGMNSLVGRAGIEKIYDEKLRGWRGGRQIEVNARGQLIRVLSEKNAQPGEDITLTLDLELQKKVMESMQGKHAAVAVMDLETEGLLVLASTPAFDPNVFVSTGKAQERAAFLKNPESPLLDRGVSGAYPPGSVFKLITAMAALDLGKITPETRFYCNRTFRLKTDSRPYHCWYEHGHGSLNLYEALERSCNVYFYNLGSRLTPEDIAKYAHEFGLGEKMTLELTAMTDGLVPDSEWKMKRLKQPWYQGETLSYAIGQSYLLTSPVQILRLTAIIAKDGRKVEPVLIKEKDAPKPEGKIAIKPEFLRAIRRGMLQVVESDYGTGQLARVNFGKIAAKTGTAQVPPRKAHGWMTGFFPYENPKIAFVVFVENGGSGGISGAAIVKSMLQAWRGDVPKVV